MNSPFDKKKAAERSKTHSRAGLGAEFFTLFSIMWDSAALNLLYRFRAPFWFKAFFVMGGILVTVNSLYLWRQRLKGGGVSLKLPQDPVPHGVPVAVEFQIARSTELDQWNVEAEIESSTRNQSGFGLIWSRDFAAHQSGAQRIKAEVTLPNDLPSTAASDRDTTYRVTLTLKAPGLQWPFDLKTRTAHADEISAWRAK